MLQRGDAGGVFQFEGQGMRDVLRQMRPDRFEDLIAAVALYRPGPMANIPAYCQRKHGEAWEPPHPELHDILAETYGIMVYQEQVMQIAQRWAATAWAAPTCCAARWARRSARRWKRSADLHRRRHQARHPRRRPPKCST
jgi:DNA polymerase-3 subunit alpha